MHVPTIIHIILYTRTVCGSCDQCQPQLSICGTVWEEAVSRCMILISSVLCTRKQKLYLLRERDGKGCRNLKRDEKSTKTRGGIQDGRKFKDLHVRIHAY